MKGTALAILHAKYALSYSEQTENVPVQVLAYGTLAAVSFFANQWDLALQMPDKPYSLLEQAGILPSRIYKQQHVKELRDLMVHC